VGKTRLLAVAACAAAVVGVGAAGALAGEIKGPPAPPCGPNCGIPGGIGTPENRTAAEAHSNSLCSFSGLNDYDSLLGQVSKQTQTPADGPHGAPGLGLEVAPGVFISCRGNGTHK